MKVMMAGLALVVAMAFVGLMVSNARGVAMEAAAEGEQVIDKAKDAAEGDAPKEKPRRVDPKMAMIEKALASVEAAQVALEGDDKDAAVAAMAKAKAELQARKASMQRPARKPADKPADGEEKDRPKKNTDE